MAINMWNWQVLILVPVAAAACAPLREPKDLTSRHLVAAAANTIERFRANSEFQPFALPFPPVGNMLLRALLRDDPKGRRVCNPPAGDVAPCVSAETIRGRAELHSALPTEDSR